MFTFSLIDGESPSKITLYSIPKDFKELFLQLADIYPSRTKNLMGFNKTLLKNNKTVKTFDESIEENDTIIVITNIIGG